MPYRRLAFAVVMIAIGGIFFSTGADARDQIRAVGSSTVYPFVTSVAENFSKSSSFHAPIVEPTGTGGGIKLFCAGTGESYPDIANALRPMKPSEKELCTKNGVTSIAEFMIGYDGIVIADSRKGQPFKLTKKQLFLALAKRVPQNGALVFNPYKTWKQVDATLPDQKIEIYGPPPTSGTRDAFVELVMEPSCVELPEYKKAYPDSDTRKKACTELREDGGYIEAGENDNLIVQKLAHNDTALGIFGYSFLEQNPEIIQGALIDGVEPSFENIADGKYSISRPLYVYVKKQHIGMVPGIQEFITELTSDRAVGEEGYVTEKGLVPLPKAAHDKNKVAAAALAVK